MTLSIKLPLIVVTLIDLLLFAWELGWNINITINGSNDDPRIIEGKLIQEFEDYYGKLPFANIVR